ncbi:MAG: hypothetical protein ACOC5T_09840 [Elusimicrobiota bacterium]
MNNNDFKVDFLGIGWPRCATSWIYECLKEHSEICMAEKKETHYFTVNFKKGINYYHDCFKHCDLNAIKGEYSPDYIWGGKETINRIK